MNRILVVVFGDASKAFAGRDALRSLDHHGITLRAYAMIVKKPHGTSIINEEADSGPLETLVGTSLGGLIGLLGGPSGVVVGALAGSLAGITADVHNARVGTDFVDDVSRQLTPGKFALVAEVEEESTSLVDECMEELGGVVYRRALSEVNHTIHEENVNAMKADLAQMKAEAAKAHADRKARLQERINQLDSKIQAQLQKAKDRREAAERQEKAKAEILKGKAAGEQAKAAGTTDNLAHEDLNAARK